MVVGRVRQVVVLCRVNNTKYYLGGLVTGRYWRGGRFIEVVFKVVSTVLYIFSQKIKTACMKFVA